MSKLFIIMVSLITGPCDTTVADYQPPIDCIPINLTNYTPYLVDDAGLPLLQNGQLQFYTETNMQCMVPCDMTGALVPITQDSIGYFAACIKDWQGYHITVDGQRLWCIDQFGNSLYTKPYYNKNWQQWVIPVDVLTHVPTSYLTYNWVN